MLLQTPELGEGDSPVADDLRRLKQLPAEAIDELRTYLARLLAGDKREDEVCIWLNRETKQCQEQPGPLLLRRQVKRVQASP